MRRGLTLLLAGAFLATACTPSTTATPSPQKTADIKRAKIDISYSSFTDQDIHKVSSKKALTAALDAVRELVKSRGGKDDVPTPDFQDASETIVPDFDKFAKAASALAAENPQVPATAIADAAIGGMIKASPDCHTYYVDASGKVFQSRASAALGSDARVPSGGTQLSPPDQIGLQAKLLPGGIVYITFREFLITGTYKVTDEVRKVLDKGVAAGAKAWLFDFRGNVGGNGADAMASWFLNGEPTLKVAVRTGNAGTMTANKDLRLSSAYQLPIAIVQNNRGGSAPEVLTAGLKENKRAIVVGSKSTGCLGATSPTQLSDGSAISIAVQEFVGAVTGTLYNNNGIPPDVAADDNSAVDAAIKALAAQI